MGLIIGGILHNLISPLNDVIVKNRLSNDIFDSLGSSK